MNAFNSHCALCCLSHRHLQLYFPLTGLQCSRAITPPRTARRLWLVTSDATTVKTVFDFNHTLSHKKMSGYVQNMQLLGGATFTKPAIEEGWNIWQDSLANSQRTLVTVVKTRAKSSKNNTSP